MEPEGSMGDSVTRELSHDSARSETPSTHRSSMRGTWEILPTSSGQHRLERSGNALGDKLDRHDARKSDGGIVPQKHSNKAQAAKDVEGRPATKRNIQHAAAGRTQRRETASIGCT
jgi:hypothetical protein